jgi:rubrerythrin
MDTLTVKTDQFLDACFEVESTTAEMYYYFAELFNDDTEITRLWIKTAMEEENHARHVQMAKKMVMSINWISIEAWHNASRAMAMVKQIARGVHHSPPSLANALRLSIQCENRMDYLHMQNAILMKENAGNSMFRAMLMEDRGHTMMLMTALNELPTTAPGQEGDDIFALYGISEFCPAV